MQYLADCPCVQVILSKDGRSREQILWTSYQLAAYLFQQVIFWCLYMTYMYLYALYLDYKHHDDLECLVMFMYPMHNTVLDSSQAISNTRMNFLKMFKNLNVTSLVDLSNVKYYFRNFISLWDQVCLEFAYLHLSFP